MSQSYRYSPTAGAPVIEVLPNVEVIPSITGGAQRTVLPSQRGNLTASLTQLAPPSEAAAPGTRISLGTPQVSQVSQMSQQTPRQRVLTQALEERQLIPERVVTQSTPRGTQAQYIKVRDTMGNRCLVDVTAVEGEVPLTPQSMVSLHRTRQETAGPGMASQLSGMGMEVMGFAECSQNGVCTVTRVANGEPVETRYVTLGGAGDMGEGPSGRLPIVSYGDITRATPAATLGLMSSMATKIRTTTHARTSQGVTQELKRLDEASHELGKFRQVYEKAAKDLETSIQSLMNLLKQWGNVNVSTLPQGEATKLMALQTNLSDRTERFKSVENIAGAVLNAAPTSTDYVAKTKAATTAVADLGKNTRTRVDTIKA